MLDTLPVEILELIIHQLSILPRGGNGSITGSYNPRAAKPGYTSFPGWYISKNPCDLLNLSQSSKHLQSVTHQIIYRNLACFGFSQFHADCLEYAVSGCITRPLSVEAFNSIYNTGKTQLVFEAHHRAVPEPALQHVRFLFLSTNALPYHPWLLRFTSNMTKLEEVFIYMDVEANVADTAYLLRLSLSTKITRVFMFISELN